MKYLKKIGRGSASITTSSDDVSVTRWMDNSAVHTVSSYAGLGPSGKVRKWSRKDKKYVEVDRPCSCEVYNKHMGGVNLLDLSQCIPIKSGTADGICASFITCSM